MSIAIRWQGKKKREKRGEKNGTAKPSRLNDMQRGAFAGAAKRRLPIFLSTLLCKMVRILIGLVVLFCSWSPGTTKVSVATKTSRVCLCNSSLSTLRMMMMTTTLTRPVSQSSVRPLVVDQHYSEKVLLKVISYPFVFRVRSFHPERISCPVSLFSLLSVCLSALPAPTQTKAADAPAIHLGRNARQHQGGSFECQPYARDVLPPQHDLLYAINPLWPG